MFTNPEAEEPIQRNSRHSIPTEPQKPISEVLTGGEASILTYRVKPSKPIYDISTPHMQNGTRLSHMTRVSQPKVEEAQPLSTEQILLNNRDEFMEDMSVSHIDERSKCACVLF
jgi:hypothetical protein